ncbi:concanavalin A-like lectin/glucanase domain-containing protein, partial [Cercophora newfieldiana]
MATLVCAASAVVAGPPCVEGTTTYVLEDEYKPSNFFDKFKFWTDADPSGGYISYQPRDVAEAEGLIKTNADDVYIGVENTEWWPSNGRKSVRIQSKDEYNSGLFITDFSHFPKPTCSAWPAFWMYGPTWPDDGEIDLYEGWHDPGFNHITAHTFDDVAGDCILQPTLFDGSVVNTNCDINSNTWYNEGCGVKETSGQWGNANGGVYAMEWTEDFIKVWSWPTKPADVAAGEPDPTTWGKPHFAVTSASCNIGKAFNNMKFVFNIDICG